ncbi:HflC protein [Candidatus Endobugula sertula]|uniref:Protein HflC n=1 Tax=Candidatus Endobugula sertula TaxID=62101 RepID=A0A1D2QMP3_9GAMM|nr:HflC protein [Candidatus Endobugula sertula]
MSMKNIVAIIAFGFVVILAMSSIYILPEYKKAVVLRFGKLQEVHPKVGLNVKLPFADEVIAFDARILTLDANPESYFTVQNKRLIVDSYAKWRVSDPALYYTSTGGSIDVSGRRLSVRISDGLRNEFGKRTLHEAVSGERDELMVSLIETINQTVGDQLGVEIVDIRVKRIDLPDDVRESVYRRMEADRAKEAREYRSKGKEQAEFIKADADRQKTVIEAEAYRDAQLLRGEGDAKAASLYAAAYNRNPEFYSFVRSLNAYKTTFQNKGDIMLVDPDSDFFRYLKDSKGDK